MAINITIEYENKKILYELFTMSGDEDELGFYGVSNLSGNIVRLYDALELPRPDDDLLHTVSGKLNGMPITIEYSRRKTWNTQPFSYVYLVIIYSPNTSISFSAYATTEDIITYLYNYSGNTGGAYGYNYKNKKYVLLSGPSSWRASANGSTNGVYFYSQNMQNGSLPPFLQRDIKAESTYAGIYYNHQQERNYYTSKLATSNSLINFIEYLNNYAKTHPNVTPITPPTYPDDPDDDNTGDPTNPVPGDQDTTSDTIGIPVKPTIDVTGTGFVTLYNPSAIDIRNLAHFMWSGEFVDLIKKMFSAPFDCLIGLKLIYAPITTGSSQTIWLGNVESDVSAPKITDQFTDFDCGTITLNGYFGSFLDYAPYTKVTIFLPFIGYKQLNVDEVMNAQLHLVYRIDAYSGACIAFLHVTKTIGSTNLSSTLYEFDGNCAMDIPFTSGDMSRYVAAILSTAASTAGAVVSMGAGAKLGTASIPQTSSDTWTKNPMEKKTVTGLTDLGNGSAELIGGKPQIQRGGSLAGANASMAIKQAYLIIERPMQQMPSDYANFIGIPLNMTKTLSQVSGFTVVSQIFMSSSSATKDELTMIDSLLRQGVII